MGCEHCLQWKLLVILGRTMPYYIKKGCLEGPFTKYYPPLIANVLSFPNQF